MEKKWLVSALTIALCAVLVIGGILALGARRSQGRAGGARAAAADGKPAEAPAAVTQSPAVQAEEELLGRIAAMEQEQQGLLQTVEDVRQERDGLAGQVTALNQTLDETRDALEAARQENERLLEQNRALDAENAEMRENAAADARERDALQEQMDALGRELDGAQKEAAQNQAEGDWQRGRAEALEAALEEALLENERLLAQAQALEGEGERLWQELAAVTQERDGLSARLSGLSEENAAAVQSLEETSLRLSALQETAEALVREKEALDRAVAAAQEELKASQTETKRMQAEWDALNQALNGALDKARQENEALRREADAMDQQLEEEREAQVRAREQMEARIAQLRGSLEETEAALDKARQDSQALQGQLSDALAALDQTREALKAESEEKQALADQAAALQRQLEGARQSLDSAENLNGQLQSQLLHTLTLRQSGAVDWSAALSQRGEDDLDLLLRWNVGLENKASALAVREGLIPSGEEQASGGFVALRVNGDEITEGELLRAVDQGLLLQKILLEARPGLAGSPLLTQDREEAARETLQDMTVNLALWQQAENLGLDCFSDQEKQDIRARAEKMQTESGIPADDFIPGLAAVRVMEKLREWTVRDVTVTQEELARAARAKQAEQLKLYEQDKDAYARRMEEEDFLCFFLPDTARRVKHIFLEADVSACRQLQEELKNASRRLEDAEYELLLAKGENDPDRALALEDKISGLKEKKEALQAAYDAAAPEAEEKLARAQRAIDDIYAVMERPEGDFDALIARYSDDDAMPAGGYVVFEGCEKPYPQFVRTALDLLREGAVSRPQELPDGYHILYYSQDMGAPWAALQAARSRLRDEMLKEKQRAAWDAALFQWLNGADIWVDAGVYDM